MPGPAGCCGWRSHMADPALAGGARVRLHRGNVAVVIPALNEALRIREVVLDARAHCEHVLVVDAGSDAGTPGCIDAPDGHVLRTWKSGGRGKDVEVRLGYRGCRA